MTIGANCDVITQRRVDLGHMLRKIISRSSLSPRNVRVANSHDNLTKLRAAVLVHLNDFGAKTNAKSTLSSARNHNATIDNVCVLFWRQNQRAAMINVPGGQLTRVLAANFRSTNYHSLDRGQKLCRTKFDNYCAICNFCRSLPYRSIRKLCFD